MRLVERIEKQKMRAVKLWLAWPLLLMATTPRLCAQAPELSADSLVQKMIAARGGADRLKAIKTQRVTGNFSLGALEGPLLLEFKRPNKMRMEIGIRGQTIVRVYDGKGSGWMINPFAPEKGPTAMSGNDLKNASDESDFDGPLVDYQSKGTQIEYAGRGDVQGKAAYKLKLITKSGDVRTYFIDAENFLLLEWEGIRRNADQEIPVQTFFRDYRDVGGIKFAFEIETNSPGDAPAQKLTVSKIELDVTLDDARFAKPALPSDR